MTTFKEMWSELQQPGKPMPFLLIDCAGIDGGSAQISRYIFSDIQCLFVGNLATELADVAPYFGQLKSLDSVVARTVEHLLRKKIGVLVIPRKNPVNSFYFNFSELYRHFRKLNMVQGPDGEQLFFRYYDPRVLMKVVKVFDAAQLDELFGPVSSFFMFENENSLIGLRKETTPTQPLVP